MATVPDSDPNSGMVDESQQGKGTGQTEEDSRERIANIARRERVLEELGSHIEGSKARHRRFRAGELLRIAIPLTALNVMMSGAAWVSISSAIQATNRATASLIKDVDASREMETLSILQGVQENNKNLLEQIQENRQVADNIAKMTLKSSGLIDSITKIQENEVQAGVERQKLLESVQQLLIATGQQVQAVKEDVKQSSDTVAQQIKPTVITKTKTVVRTRTVKPPTLLEKIFGGNSTTRKKRQ